MQKKMLKMFISVLIIYVGIIIVDFTLSKFDKRPIFAVPIHRHKDGGTVEYYGLGYKVIKYNILDKELEIKQGRKDAEFGFWNLKYKDV